MVTARVLSSRQCAGVAPSGGPLRRIDLAGFDKPQLDFRRQFRGFGGGVPSRPLQGHRTGFQRQRGLTCRAARGGRQFDGFAPQFRRDGVAGEQFGSGGEDPVVVGADDQAGAGRTQRELVVNVAFPVGHDGDADRTRHQRLRRFQGRFQPAVAFLFLERGFAAQGFFAAGAGVEGRVHQAQKGTGIRVHGDGRMQVAAVFLPVVAQTGGVLDDQDMQPAHPGGRARGDGRDHFRGRHIVVTKETRHADLAGPATAQSADADTELAGLDQAPHQEDAAILLPRFVEAAKRMVHRESPAVVRGASIQRKRRGTRKRCVHAVGRDRATRSGTVPLRVARSVAGHDVERGAGMSLFWTASISRAIRSNNVPARSARRGQGPKIRAAGDNGAGTRGGVTAGPPKPEDSPCAVRRLDALYEAAEFAGAGNGAFPASPAAGLSRTSALSGTGASKPITGR